MCHYCFGACAEAPAAGAKKQVVVDQTMMEQAALPGTPSLAELKLTYYALCVRISIHHADYVEVCRCYQAVFEDKAVLADAARWGPVLQKMCWYHPHL
jgi:S-adenosylmethionine:diacylglycerol 3-amino-3-carboxypropyl transferase